MIEYVAISITGVSLATSISLICYNRYLKKKAVRFYQEKLEAEDAAESVRDGVREQVETLSAARLDAFRAQFEIDNSHFISQALVGQTVKSLQQSIKGNIEQRFNRISQEFLGQINDEADGLIRDLNIELCERIWDSFQAFKARVKTTPYIFPEGCRIAYTKGNRTVVVIEQKPQVRSVTFNSDLVRTNTVAREAQSRTEHGFRFTLAFPYVYFFIAIDKGKYAFHELYFRNKPMTSVREHVHLAPLPNVFRNRDDGTRPMCMGNDFDTGDEINLCRQCEMVVSDFWQRTFSDDLGDGNPDKIDKRIKNYAVWQKHTTENPLFVLTVDWHKGKTVKGVVEALLDQRTQNTVVDSVDTAIRQQLEQGVAKLTARIKQEIASAKAKGMNQFDIDQQSKQILEEVVVGHARRVFQKCAK